MRPDAKKGLEVYVDADFSGNWCKEDSYHTDIPSTSFVKSYTMNSEEIKVKNIFFKFIQAYNIHFTNI